MSWIEAHQALRDHPKKDRLAELLFNGSVPIDVSDLAAVGLLLNLWWWAVDYAKEGDLSNFSDRQIAKGCGWTGDSTLLVQSLIEAGFIDKKPRRIHDWDEYTGRLLERRERDRLRVKNWRKTGTKREPNADATHVVQGNRPTYLKSSASQSGQIPVDNSKRPLCAACDAEMAYDGDGSQNMHCPVCGEGGSS